ncbi:unnamed protein product [Acanthoscelides obtectus]|uniref:Uncharacterized protein n=1 Tax=Acanthoscelides obtectus TaxID=200917 RepID=A0A9P0LUI5_ACAOB|nr:unnamed protein product [Acanthoscelides obtectus]CAH1995180.1 unnamed protein product [Acanthoscelides obtectus]CAH1995755.1 unnamed protein product [Acanthoscelides obtectus]CAH2001606.1 unnamed protein product [Acanthoscelides obtectus]CAK1626576.1 hypothetical protein AOBTE_LOCUS3945 [Acanthoscelides obtectus]
MPKVAPTRWNYNIRTVSAVFENRESLIDCFRELENKCDKTITSKEAYGLRRALEDSDFIFFLTFFHKTLPHVAILFNQFQSRNKDRTLQRIYSKLLKMSMETMEINAEK